MALDSIFYYLSVAEDFLWTYCGIPILMILGLYISFKLKFFQIFKISEILQIFFNFFKQKNTSERGISPLNAFFASVGGCIGIGNVISVCAAVQIGGPGAVFWMWIAAFFGMVIKYSEIYLGVKFRKHLGKDNYIGGPIIYLLKVPGGKFLTKLVALLFCFYGIEVYMFKVITESFVAIWNLNELMVIIALLFLVLITAVGGINLAGVISSKLIPFFLVIFSAMCAWVFILNFKVIPATFLLIFKSAFTGHAVCGAFAGSSMLLAMSHGVRRACYTGDIGIGYSAVIHSETQESDPVKQATFGIISIILDTFIICTLSVLLILITGVWNQALPDSQIVMIALSKYFSNVQIIWPIFIFLLGYSSLIAFFAVGNKSAEFLSPKYGKIVYIIASICIFLLSSFYANENSCLTVMSITGVALLIVNLYGFIMLNKYVKFDFKE